MSLWIKAKDLFGHKFEWMREGKRVSIRWITPMHKKITLITGLPFKKGFKK